MDDQGVVDVDKKRQLLLPTERKQLQPLQLDGQLRVALEGGVRRHAFVVHGLREQGRHTCRPQTQRWMDTRRFRGVTLPSAERCSEYNFRIRSRKSRESSAAGSEVKRDLGQSQSHILNKYLDLKRLHLSCGS